jgi:hypothetical protein
VMQVARHRSGAHPEALADALVDLAPRGRTGLPLGFLSPGRSARGGTASRDST